MHPGFPIFQKQLTNPFTFRMFLLKNLPAAFIAGLRIQSMDEHQAIVSVRHKWLNRNPFRSMYFAVQSMAAEMSTGLLASGHVYRRTPAVRMLVVGLEAKFVKKVTGRAFFTCEDGEELAALVQRAADTREAQTMRCRSVGRNADGEIVSEFFITWSFKSK